MSLLNVPDEVILHLVPHLGYENEINVLCRTTRRFYALLNPVLYKRSITQRNGGHSLEWAAMNGSSPTARLTLEAGAPPAACGGEPWQPFALAAIHGHIEIIRLLYEHGVDPCSINNDWKNDIDEGNHQNKEQGHPLSMAASHGHVSIVNLLLKYGMRPDLITGHNERTSIHLAAKNGHIDVVRVLSDAGSPINAQDRNGSTPLAFAAWNGHLDIVQFLLSRGADPNIATEHAGTSLCMASRSGNIDIVRCILDHGATPNPSYPDGQKPLFQLSRAAQKGHEDIVDLLLSRFDYVKSSTKPYQQAVLLCVAALTGRITLLTELLTKQNYDPNMRVAVDRRIHIFVPYKSFHPPRTALSWAAERNQTAAIDILIAHGAIITPPIYMSPDNNGANTETPVLIRAIREGHIEAVTRLLAHGANPNHPSEALLTAVTNPPIFSLLLSHNADPTGSLPKSNLLIHALYSGNVDTLRILLDHPKGTELIMHSTSAENRIGGKPTTLFYAALYGGEGVFRLLLDRGLLTTPKHLFDHIAAQYLTLAAHGGVRLVRLLLDMGVSVHADFNEGYLVYLAATLEEEELLDLLLARGCRIDDTDSRGRTAFYLAAYNGDKNVMRRLLERGADPLIVWQGDAALSVVAKFQDAGAVEVVLRAFDERGLSLGEVEGVLKQAQEYALADDRASIARILHRFYWRRRYPFSA
ncbi:hypothetical protein ACN38_g270 [Penicillium nordicum]|uniref:F-box domain-containing protein n=1 Tax=Penicillium nordicum TaxID=229535 RepID=A0A0M9WKW2_9EURO|nr:hypothetical protein ACN38_g270 [Penicillium nordicum]